MAETKLYNQVCQYPEGRTKWMTVRCSSSQMRIVNRRDGCMTRKNWREFYMPVTPETNLQYTLVSTRLEKKVFTIYVGIQF